MAGNVTYFEVPSSDIEATQRFWGLLFGWKFHEGNFPGYSMIDGPTPMGGAPHEDASRHPRIFFAVDTSWSMTLSRWWLDWWLPVSRSSQRPASTPAS